MKTPLLVLPFAVLAASFELPGDDPVPVPRAADAAGGAGGVTQPPSTPVCIETIRDQANPADCVPVSSVPAMGSLYPLGPDLNIDPLGRVGVGTVTPSSRMHVAGDLRVEDGVAFGNNTGLGFGERIFDISHRIDDFSAHNSWRGIYSSFELDPQLDLTGQDATFFFSHLLDARIATGNLNDMEFLLGPWMGASHWGSGSVNCMIGTHHSASTFNDSHCVKQVGAWVVSAASHTATVDDNYSINVRSGHRGSAGQVTNNVGIRIESPHASAPLINHYGLFLQDQDFGQNASYAIYSEGGASYFAGDVGIGTDAPGYKLQVGEPGDGTEARANAWNLLSSRRYKRDIETLDELECGAILNAIVDTDVVHYKYRGDEDGEVHIGVIAEESPDEILSKDRGAVSLGDYAAFLMAGIKAQQHEIEELRSTHQSEIASLRAELDELRRALDGGR